MEFTLRKLTLDDAEDLAKAANNPNVARYLRKVFPCPYKMQDAIDYINYAIDNLAAARRWRFYCPRPSKKFLNTTKINIIFVGLAARPGQLAQ